MIFQIDYEKIESVLTKLIQKGYNIQITNKFLSGFGPKYNDTDFKFDNVEKRIIDSTKEIIANSFVFDIIVTKYDNRLDIWNWKTPAGQKLCQEMRIKKCLSVESIDEKNNFYRWDQYCKFDEWKLRPNVKVEWNYF